MCFSFLWLSNKITSLYNFDWELSLLCGDTMESLVPDNVFCFFADLKQCTGLEIVMIQFCVSSEKSEGSCYVPSAILFYWFITLSKILKARTNGLLGWFATPWALSAGLSLNQCNKCIICQSPWSLKAIPLTAHYSSGLLCSLSWAPLSSVHWYPTRHL